VGYLAGADGDPRAPIINVKNIDSGPPMRQCERFERTHHQR
jgi:hypothetical protein